MTTLTDPELYKNNLLDYLERRTSPPLENLSFLNIEAIKNISIFERDTFLSDSISDGRHRTFYKIFILGAGGVTSWFLPQLLKIIYNYKIKNNCPRTYEIVLMDGDTVNLSAVYKSFLIYLELWYNRQ